MELDSDLRARVDDAMSDLQQSLTASLLLSRQQRAPGKALFDLVCAHLNLVEGDYFSLEFLDHRKMAVSRGGVETTEKFAHAKCFRPARAKALPYTHTARALSHPRLL